jgi:hypothetical protein
MKDYKNLDKQQYEIEEGNAIKGAMNGCALMLIAVVIVLSFAGWIGEALADAPKIYSQDGKYLGNLSANQLDPDSVNNELGQYGSRFSPDSINNEYGQYGSEFSSESARNPYAINPPVIIGDE